MSPISIKKQNAESQCRHISDLSHDVANNDMHAKCTRKKGSFEVNAQKIGLGHWSGCFGYTDVIVRRISLLQQLLVKVERRV